MPSTLIYFSWDSPRNPWLGGGGTRRDTEILSRFSTEFSATKMFVGSFPGATRERISNIEYIPLGFGKSEWMSRLTYVIFAQFLILYLSFWAPKSTLGITLSPYSPFWTARFHSQCFGVIHHVILEEWKAKIGRFWGSILCFIEGSYYKIFRKVIVVNTDVQDWFKQHSPRAQTFLSANACDQSLLDLVDLSHTVSPNMLFFGRIDRYMKGIDLLLEAYTLIHAQIPQWKLVLAGRMATDADRQDLQQRIQSLGLSECVQIHENPSEEFKHQLFAQAHFFVSPSRFEGWGIAALEACAAGKAVVVSDASGFKSSIAPGNCGILCPVGNVPYLSQKMLELAVDSQKRNELAAQSRRWAAELNWDQIASKELNWILGRGR